METADLQP